MDAVAEHGHERDEREPDHQRRRGRRRPRRIPHGILRRERTGCAAELARRPTENGRQQRDETGRDARGARDQRESAEREREQRAARAEPVARHGVAERERGEHEQRDADEGRLAASHPLRQNTACGRDRRNPRRARRRNDPGNYRHDAAEQQRHDERARRVHGRGLREPEPERAEQRAQALGQAEAEEEAEHRREHAERG